KRHTSARKPAVFLLASQEVFLSPCQLISVKTRVKGLDTDELAGSAPPPPDPLTLMTLPLTSQFFTCSKSLPKRLDIEGLFWLWIMLPMAPCVSITPKGRAY